MAKPDPELDPIPKETPKPAPASEEEQMILMQQAVKEYEQLDKTDPRFLGIDLNEKEYWIKGNKFKIKQLGFNSKKEISKYFDKHDSLAKDYSELIEASDAAKRITILQEMDQMKDSIIEKTIPLMLSDAKGNFDTEKWFSDEIPAGVWFDVATDLYLFLRGSGSKEDTLRSMMH